MVTEVSPPMNYPDKNGRAAGIATALVEQVLTTAGIDYDIRFYPWIRAYNLALEQPNVLIYTIYRNQQRAPLFHWFCPLPDSGNIQLYKLSKHGHIQLGSLAEAKQYRIGATRNGIGHQFLQSKGFDEQQLDISVDEETNIRKLLAGRIDLLLQSEQVLAAHLQQLTIPPSWFEPAILLFERTRFPNCMALSRQTSPVIINKVRRAFELLLSSETAPPQSAPVDKDHQLQ